MALNIASTDPPMTLGQREELQELFIPLCVQPHEIVFTPSLGDVRSKQQLCDFVDRLLEKLIHQYPTTVSPQPGAWKLVRANTDLDLEKWDPCSLELDTVLFITSNMKNPCPIIANTTAIHNGPWTWGGRIMSVRFPDQGAYVLEGHNRVLIVLRCQTKFRISNKKKRIDETNHTIFIPMTHTVQDVLRLIQASHVSGVFSEPDEHDLRSSTSSARELGWKHGTTLRLELW